MEALYNNYIKINRKKINICDRAYELKLSKMENNNSFILND